MKRLLAIIVSMTVAAAAACGADDVRKEQGRAGADDLEIVRSRLWETFLEQGPQGADEVLGLVRTQGEEGTWADVDYSDTSGAVWKPINHLSKLRRLAAALVDQRGKLRGDERVRAALVNGLRAWGRLDPKSSNWWYNTIGAPLALGPVLVLARDELPADVLETATRQLARGWPPDRNMTAQNLVWRARSGLLRGVIERDVKLIGEAASAIAGTIVVTSAEGIQPDASFHQHGPMPYSGGYGMAFSSDSAAFAALVRGTSFALSDEQVATLSRYMLDGQQWRVRGTWYDMSCCGREVSRAGAQRRARSLIAPARDMAALGTDRSGEFADMARRIEQAAGKPSDMQGGPVGNRHYVRADLMIHRRPEFYVSVRMLSSRLLATESINNENLLGRHQADGVTYVLRRGDEYDGLSPVWDWRRLPGATGEQSDRPPEGFRGSIRGAESFAGGVSNGVHGAAANVFRHDGVAAKKAWFFLDDMAVCLGAGVSSSVDGPIATSINQCRLVGDVTLSPSAGNLPRSDEAAVRGRSWVHHDGVAYVQLADSSELHVDRRRRTGSWRRINKSQSDKTVEADVFSLWLAHGVRPEAASYAYAIVPGVEAGGVERAVNQLNETARWVNTATVQGVSRGAVGCAAGVFYEPGKVGFADDDWIAADQACLVLTCKTGEGVQITAADPLQRREGLRVRIGLPGCEDTVVELPGGDAAGGSVSVTTKAVKGNQ